MNGDDDDVIKIATSSNSGLAAAAAADGLTPGGGGLHGRDDISPAHRPCSVDGVALSDWPPARVTASAPSPSDVVVCLGSCRHGYQTTATTTSSRNWTPVPPPPSYADSVVCHCVALAPPPPPSRHTHYHRHYPESTLLTSRAAQLNYYTNRT